MGEEETAVYYHCFTETGIRWRNWRRKVRYFDYHSIYKVSYEQTSKNGWVKIRSIQLPKHIKLGFDTNQFDATILYAQLQYRLEMGHWVQVWEDERFQQILSGRPGVRFLQDQDRKSTRLNSSHYTISYAVFCWKKKRV